MHRPGGRVGRRVGPEQDPSRPALHEVPRRVRLSPQLGDPGRDVDVPVRVGSEHPVHAGEVLRRAPDMRPDERRPGVPGDDRLEAVDELVERWEPVRLGAPAGPRRPEVPVGVLAQLLVALVRGVERLEERDRVGDVDRHRQAELPRRRPQRVEAGVVHRHESAPGVARPQPQELPHLEAARPRRGAVPQPGRLHLPEVGAPGPHGVVETGEHRDAVPERRPVLQLACEGVAPAAVEVHDRGDVRGVEGRRQLGRGPPVPAVREWGGAEVVVGVDGRDRRAGERGRVAGPQARTAARRRRGGDRPATRLAVRPPEVPYPLSPDSVMPRTKYFWATMNRMIIGSRLTSAPAIISGHLPTNWPWKNARPTVVV